MDDSQLGLLIKGILTDFIDDKEKLEEATAQVVKSFLMTRQGANLPDEGKATNFSDKEIAGDEQHKAAEETKAEEKPYGGKRIKGIVSTPGYGEDGDSVPITVLDPRS